ncbi:30S ribosome-binding factor RbfA [Goodfellowiella coeruleoviolacea]|uniref:Ribosome-binding factor A n=1 Tax=Goodfellowiella coeruleoviolacea TaxID=334858 RepID=A0AAE3GK06_9PSEU|nr:30S ribosome-binding factor RbfA [Goodfellowiella coeruleoviolacea]MCP2169615.1 ribosome-binding factor A [Goodfellowiella coeruleoviolacea]
MADVARARRLAKRIAQIVASALEHQVKDPRLARVTITDARVTADLRDATVYYTVLGDSLEAPPDTAGAAAALNSAKGVLRSLVGQQTGVRFTPTLTFVADEVPDAARRLDELLTRAREADAEVARLASGAEPAGEADPYRAPRAEDDDEDGDTAEDANADADTPVAEHRRS